MPQVPRIPPRQPITGRQRQVPPTAPPVSGTGVRGGKLPPQRTPPTAPPATRPPVSEKPSVGKMGRGAPIAATKPKQMIEPVGKVKEPTQVRSQYNPLVGATRMPSATKKGY